MRQVNVLEWTGILVYLECYEGRIHTSSLELIGEAHRLAGETGDDVYVIGIGRNMDAVQHALQGLPVRRAYLYEAEDEYSPDLYEEITTACIQKIQPAIVLIGGTYEGRALAPRLAVSFGTGLTADCTSLQVDSDKNLVQTRPAFGGNVMASIVTQYSRPQFATVRPGVMEKVSAEFDIDTEVIIEKIDKKSESVRVIRTETVEETDAITGQDLLVVAGRGVRKKEDLDMLRELAGLLGGKLASSRALVEKGWMSPKEQIGLSGNSVSPRYMITCGVSGTVQFMAGMKNTKNIIAINTDPNARIFEIAHYPICGDIYEIVPELINVLKGRKGDGHTETAVSTDGERN